MPPAQTIVSDDAGVWTVRLVQNGRTQVYFCGSRSLALRFAGVLRASRVAPARTPEPQSSFVRWFAQVLKRISQTPPQMRVLAHRL